MRNRPGPLRPDPLSSRPWFPPAVVLAACLGLVALDAALTLAATGDVRCVVVKCVVVK